MLLRQRLQASRGLETAGMCGSKASAIRPGHRRISKAGGLRQVLLHGAEVHGVHDGVAVLVGEVGRQLELEVDLADEPGGRVEVRAQVSLEPCGSRSRCCMKPSA